MKATFATIVAIAVLVSGICIYASNAISEAADTLMEYNSQLSYAADANDLVSAMQAANELLGGWEARFSRLAHLIPHEDLDKVSLSITRIWARVRLHDLKGLSVETALLGEHLDHLMHKEEPSADNLL